MSGEDIPYQLRPNKFIDRQMFIDLLCHLVPSVGASKYVYISMGGKHLVDHSSVYRSVGIKKLFSFEAKAAVVLRQIANRPIDNAVCKALSSGELASELDNILSLFPGTTNAVVWLDYTSPHDRRTQINELIEIGKRLQAGDIIRITLNANLGTLDGSKGSSTWKEEGYNSPGEYRCLRLKDQLGDLVPVGITNIGEDDFPAVLLKCLEMAFSKIESARNNISFKSVLNTTYRDGQRMVTSTCVVTSRADQISPFTNFNTWHFIPESWDKATAIAAPDLSTREKYKIDEYLSFDLNDIADKLNFELGDNRGKSLEILASYKCLHRYFPFFHNVET